MKRHLLRSMMLALLLALASFRAAAIDKTVDTILDIVIQELSPELAPAKPLVVCMIDGGNAVSCTKSFGAGYVDQVKGEAKKSLPVDPGGPEVKLVLDIVMAAKDEKWDVVIGKGGPYVARAVICAVFVPPGVKSFGCPVIGYVIEHHAGSVKQALTYLTTGDIPGLVKFLGAQFGPEIVCQIIPSSALPAGASELKALGCSVLGEILAGAKKIADELAGAAVKGADAVENLLFGDDSHMPYDKYYGLYWQPWYHYGTWLCLTQNCTGLGSLNASVGDPCVEYFDSHNQYKSTAEKTCGDMRNKFDKEVKSFKAAMAAAGEVHKQEANALAKQQAVNDWYQALNVAGRKKAFAAKCEGGMKNRFPFSDPNPGACEFIKKSPAYKNKAFQPLLDKHYKKCMASAAKQMPSPTAWAQVCLGPADKFAADYAAAKKDVDNTVKMLEGLGCKKVQKSMATEPGLSCATFPGYDVCKSAYAGQIPCSLDNNKADTTLADQILKLLGSKRCKIHDEVKTVPCPKKDGTVGTCPLHEKNILCSRPWKIDLCDSLLGQLAGKSGVSTTVKCKGDAAGLEAFSKLEGQASAIIGKLNGSAGVIGTKEGLGDAKAKGFAGTGACKTTWDPLAIQCPGGELLGHPEVILPACLPDPKQDGADAPCLVDKPAAAKIPAPGKLEIYQGPLQGGGAKALPPPPLMVPAVGLPPLGPPPPATPQTGQPASPAQSPRSSTPPLMPAPPAIAPPSATLAPPSPMPAAPAAVEEPPRGAAPPPSPLAPATPSSPDARPPASGQTTRNPRRQQQ
jgi:hypothetical protein